MALPLPVVLSLAQACAPSVAPATLLSVVRTESAFEPLTIGVNERPHRTLHAATAETATRLATALLAQGKNIDLGLTQINARNLSRLRLSVAEAFEPCRNLAGGAQILTDAYLGAHRSAPEPQAALRAALSLYNTGDSERGLRNGYVLKVAQAAARIVPALASAGAAGSPANHTEPPMDAVQLTAAAASDGSAPTPPLDVFARAPSRSLVWTSPPPSADRSRPTVQSPMSGDPT